ncbi:MAG: hypothetical protein WD360_05735 [Nitriliruptoraceae bacterium]
MFDADQYKLTTRHKKLDRTASLNKIKIACSRYATANNVAGTCKLAVAGATR